jgi:hypothetical protein
MKFSVFCLSVFCVWCLFLVPATSQVQTFTKPVLMFDNATADVVPPKHPTIQSRAHQLFTERGSSEEMIPLRDKRGMTRIAYMRPGAQQTNCTPYADMYFDAQGRWISTEEYFTNEGDSLKGTGRIVAQICNAIEAKGYKVGICEEGGNPSLWHISTPYSTWYECEIFKNTIDNVALAITIDIPPYRAPNQRIYGTAYFDDKGKFVRIQTKSKVKIANALQNAGSAGNKK